MTWQHDLGAEVYIPARVVGRSEFERGYPTYMVEFERNGHTERNWFRADDFEPDEDDDYTDDIESVVGRGRKAEGHE